MAEGARTRFDVCFGSKADMCVAKSNVCFTPESGHVHCTRLCLLWPNADIPTCGHSLLFSTDRAIAGATEVYRNFVDLTGEFERRLVSEINRRANILANVQSFAN